MKENGIVDLTDCTEFRQVIQARPPRLVHGTLILLASLLGTALAWATWTKADLVVRAPGRVRPVASPLRIVNAGRGEVLSASVGGRVAEVNVRQGDEVHQGDAMIRLDTGQLDTEIAKRRRTIEAAEEELSNQARLGELLSRQFEATQARAAAELAQAQGEVRQAKERQGSDVRLAQQELAYAGREHLQLTRLVAVRAAAPAEVAKATVQLREAEEKLRKAQLPVDEGRVRVLEQALAGLDKDEAVKRQELALKQGLKQGELAAARLELANLERERQQAVLQSPVDGVVTVGDVKVGDVLQPGAVVLEIAEQKGFRFEVAIPSEEVGQLRVGMPVRVKLDAYDYQRYGTVAGTVCFIAPDSGVAEGQRTATYLVRIELQGDEVGRGDYHGRVKLGMAGQAEIVSSQERLLTLLVKKILQTISLG